MVWFLPAINISPPYMLHQHHHSCPKVLVWVQRPIAVAGCPTLTDQCLRTVGQTAAPLRTLLRVRHPTCHERTVSPGRGPSHRLFRRRLLLHDADCSVRKSGSRTGPRSSSSWCSGTRAGQPHHPRHLHVPRQRVSNTSLPPLLAQGSPLPVALRMPLLEVHMPLLLEVHMLRPDASMPVRAARMSLPARRLLPRVTALRFPPQ